jgi:hypothetical protein
MNELEGLFNGKEDLRKWVASAEAQVLEWKSKPARFRPEVAQSEISKIGDLQVTWANETYLQKVNML